jgi:hypothetical protein
MSVPQTVDMVMRTTASPGSSTAGSGLSSTAICPLRLKITAFTTSAG